MTISAYSGCLPNSALTHLLLLPLIKLFEWYKSLAITPKVKEDNQCNPKRYYHTTSRVSPSPSSSSSHARFWIESSLCSGLDATINFSCGMQYQLQPGLPPLILVWQSNINYSPAERMFSDNRHPKAYLFHPPTLIHSISASYSGIFIPVKVVTGTLHPGGAIPSSPYNCTTARAVVVTPYKESTPHYHCCVEWIQSGDLNFVHLSLVIPLDAMPVCCEYLRSAFVLNL